MLREAHIMSQFDHENVLSLMGIIWEHGEAPVVITPYMVKGSLLDIIRKSELVSEYHRRLWATNGVKLISQGLALSGVGGVQTLAYIQWCPLDLRLL